MDCLSSVRIFKSEKRLIIVCKLDGMGPLGINDIPHEYINYDLSKPVISILREEQHKSIVQKLFCKHHYIPLANLIDCRDPSERNERTLLYCAGCRKIKWTRKYYEAPYIYDPYENELVRKNYIY